MSNDLLINMSKYQVNDCTQQLFDQLDQKYFDLIIKSPSDSVENFINQKLLEMTNKLNDNGLNTALAIKKLDYILGMSKNERYALAISDMQKRSMPIPKQYQHLLVQKSNNMDRDILLTPNIIRIKILLYGVPYSILIFMIGLIIGYSLNN